MIGLDPSGSGFRESGFGDSGSGYSIYAISLFFYAHTYTHIHTCAFIFLEKKAFFGWLDRWLKIINPNNCPNYLR